MKFKYVFIIFLLCSCNTSYQASKKVFEDFYSSKGFALIFNQSDFDSKIVSKTINNLELEVAHRFLGRNKYLLITNPINNKSLEIKITKKAKFPDFYNVLISKKLADELGLDYKYPYVEINERAKNKSFIAKKAEIYTEEKNVLEKVPVESVKIDNISLNKSNISKKIKNKSKKFSILIGEFYSQEAAQNLKNLLSDKYVKKELLKVQRVNTNRFALTSGPYYSINTLKKDHFELNRYGFENLDIKQHD